MGDEAEEGVYLGAVWVVAPSFTLYLYRMRASNKKINIQRHISIVVASKQGVGPGHLQLGGRYRHTIEKKRTNILLML